MTCLYEFSYLRDQQKAHSNPKCYILNFLIAEFPFHTQINNIFSGLLDCNVFFKFTISKRLYTDAVCERHQNLV